MVIFSSMLIYRYLSAIFHTIQIFALVDKAHLNLQWVDLTQQKIIKSKRNTNIFISLENKRLLPPIEQYNLISIYKQIINRTISTFYGVIGICNF